MPYASQELYGANSPFNPMLGRNFKVHMNHGQLISPCLGHIGSGVSSKAAFVSIIHTYIRRILEPKLGGHNLDFDGTILAKPIITGLVTEFMILQTLCPDIVHVDIDGRLALGSAVAFVVVETGFDEFGKVIPVPSLVRFLHPAILEVVPFAWSVLGIGIVVEISPANWVAKVAKEYVLWRM